VALIPISTRGILFGSRAEGKAASDSEYDLCVVSETPDEIEKITSRHPLGRLISLTALSPEAFAALKSENAGLAEKLERGITLWGTSW
jgi:predicted nucleotidyltransferase